MVATAAEVAEAGLWVNQFAAASEQIKTQAATATRSLWVSFEGWYDAAAVAALARQAASLSTIAQQSATGLTKQYVSTVTAALSGSRSITPAVPNTPLRGGVDTTLVNWRTAEAYKRAISTGSDHAEALNRALARAEGTVRGDLSLRERQVSVDLMRLLGVTDYRRIIHPELSESGTCGLCVVAADRTYHTGELMPIHPPECKCTVLPVVGDKDPGLSLNREDLDRIYAAAGSTYAKDLLNTRVTVHQHGELGPVLAREGDSFRGPSKVAIEDDPQRAARELERLLPVLRRLEADGGPEGPLTYQRDRVARLQRITSAAA